MNPAGKKTILVADDEPDMRTFVATVLETSGYAVREAEDGTAAVALARKDPPDAVVLDIMMPRIEDGMQAYLALRQDPRTAAVPIVMLSAIARKTFFHSLKNLVPESSGAVREPDGYLEKPPDAADLRSLLSRVLASGDKR
ncbi:MAG: response regulator [Thermodesulfobacteriota bacterium]